MERLGKKSGSESQEQPEGTANCKASLVMSTQRVQPRSHLHKSSAATRDPSGLFHRAGKAV